VHAAATTWAGRLHRGGLHTRGVHPFLQLLADLEEGQALGLDADGGAGARVAAFVRTVAADLEAAEASDLDPIAVAQGRLHAIEDRIDEKLCPALGHLLGLAQHIDEI